MKKNIYILVIALLFPFVSVKAQCESDAFLDNCVELIDNYTYVKVFNVTTDKKTTKVEYSSVFSKDHEYILAICSGTQKSNKKLVVNLYDRNRQLISSSYYKPKNMHVPKVGYKCSATGVYYIEAFFEDNAENCGIIILGFKKSQ